jgi:hypothetical protein
MWQGIDRRRFPRADYPCKVVALRQDSKEQFFTHTENIGVGGICVILDRCLPKFCLVTVLVYLQDGRPPLYSSGRIVWMVERQGQFDTGVEFLDLAEAEKARLEGIVEECLKRQRKSVE